jgi:hypothetical protein
MPQSVIDRVNTMAKDQPRLLTFLDRNGDEIADNTDIGTNSETAHEIPGVVGDAAQIPGVDMEINIEDTAVEHVENIVESEKRNDLNNIPEPVVKQLPTEHQTADTNDQPDFRVTSTPDEVPITPTVTVPHTVVSPTPGKRSTRVRKTVNKYIPSMTGKSYEYAATQIACNHYVPAQIVEFVLTQVTLKAAMKLWGNQAMNAAVAEMKQLHWRNSFKPVRLSELMAKQKATVLESHIFLTEKRTGEIKGRTVAGGNKQRGFIEKEDASSPTVATESVILMSIVDADEERETAILDIPNAFIQTFVEDKTKRVIVRIRGLLVDILVKLAPEIYGPYVTVDKKGQKQLLVECLNALYGTMVAALLYYEKFTNSLKKEGFKMNPYDACVWNKRIKGKQCTVCFHVDDCKISHVSKKVVNEKYRMVEEGLREHL